MKIQYKFATSFFSGFGSLLAPILPPKIDLLGTFFALRHRSFSKTWISTKPYEFLMFFNTFCSSAAPNSMPNRVREPFFLLLNLDLDLGSIFNPFRVPKWLQNASPGPQNKPLRPLLFGIVAGPPIQARIHPCPRRPRDPPETLQESPGTPPRPLQEGHGTPPRPSKRAPGPLRRRPQTKIQQS